MEKLKQPEQVDRIVSIAVDVQNDFCPGGALGVNQGDQVIDPINRLSDFTRKNNGLVIASMDWHRADTKHFESWPPHCIEGTFGAELRRDLDIRAGDVIIKKGQGGTDGYSAFEGYAANGRKLEDILLPSPGERVAVLIGGLATDYCVKNTVMDALKFADEIRQKQVGAIAVFVIEDAMKAVDLKRNDGKKAIKEMKSGGAKFINIADVVNGDVIEL